MLSERHAQALAEIERCLTAEDKALVQCFAQGFSSGRTTARRWWPPHALIVVALVLMVGCAVLGLAPATMTCAVLAVCGLFANRGRRTRFRRAGRAE